jgi:hypothetical protein
MKESDDFVNRAKFLPFRPETCLEKSSEFRESLDRESGDLRRGRS